MRSIALFSYILISSSIYLGETPLGITTQETEEYNNLIASNQLIMTYELDSETMTSNNTEMLNKEITIGGNFALLDALILLEIDTDVNHKAQKNINSSSADLIDKFYNEEYYDTFEGALISGNTALLNSMLSKNDLNQLETVLKNYSNFFTYKKKSSVLSTMATIQTTSAKLAVFLKMLNNEELTFCNSSMIYIKKLVTNRGEEFKSQEFNIVNESRTGSVYINLGYVSGYNENNIKLFVETQNRSKLNNIDQIRKDNYNIMNYNSENDELGLFGE